MATCIKCGLEAGFLSEICIACSGRSVDSSRPDPSPLAEKPIGQPPNRDASDTKDEPTVDSASSTAGAHIVSKVLGIMLIVLWFTTIFTSLAGLAGFLIIPILVPGILLFSGGMSGGKKQLIVGYSILGLVFLLVTVVISELKNFGSGISNDNLESIVCMITPWMC